MKKSFKTVLRELLRLENNERLKTVLKEIYKGLLGVTDENKSSIVEEMRDQEKGLKSYNAEVVKGEQKDTRERRDAFAHEKKELYNKEENKYDALSIKNNEILKIIEITSGEYDLRHKHLWEVVYHSIFGIAALMMAPYFLKISDVFTGVLFVFPLLAAVMCVISVLVIYSEYIRLTATAKKIQSLMNSISDAYDIFHFELAEKNKSLLKLSRIPINLYLRILFAFMFCTSLLEMVYIIVYTIINIF